MSDECWKRATRHISKKIRDKNKEYKRKRIKESPSERKV
jgi:hypothetical protein